MTGLAKRPLTGLEREGAEIASIYLRELLREIRRERGREREREKERKRERERERERARACSNVSVSGLIEDLQASQRRLLLSKMADLGGSRSAFPWPGTRGEDFL